MVNTSAMLRRTRAGVSARLVMSLNLSEASHCPENENWSVAASN